MLRDIMGLIVERLDLGGRGIQSSKFVTAFRITKGGMGDYLR